MVPNHVSLGLATAPERYYTVETLVPGMFVLLCMETQLWCIADMHLRRASFNVCCAPNCILISFPQHVSDRDTMDLAKNV